MDYSCTAQQIKFDHIYHPSLSSFSLKEEKKKKKSVRLRETLPSAIAILYSHKTTQPQQIFSIKKELKCWALEETERETEREKRKSKMECVGLGTRNFAAMGVSFWPTFPSQRITLSRKQGPFRRYGLCRHYVRVRAASTGSERYVAVNFKEGFADQEDYVKGGGSELLFVQMQQNKLMDKQSKLADKVI